LIEQSIPITKRIKSRRTSSKCWCSILYHKTTIYQCVLWVL